MKIEKGRGKILVVVLVVRPVLVLRERIVGCRLLGWGRGEAAILDLEDTDRKGLLCPPEGRAVSIQEGPR